jgi:hypothetical protein
MATALRPGYRAWKLNRDKEGHRVYKIRFVVLSNDPQNDGPSVVLSTPGLPAIGSTWAFGNDVDLYAYCTPEVVIVPTLDDEPNEVWKLDYTYSTRPLERCQTGSIEDPLLEPDKIEGSFVNYTREMTHDRFGNRLKSSSHEQLRGAQVEFDAHRAQVTIRRNVASIDLPLLTMLMNSVNDSLLWGLEPRKVKLSGASWTQLYQGICSVYYNRALTFDVDFEGFDRIVYDEGTKVLRGQWGTGQTGSGNVGEWVLLPDEDGNMPDPNNPSDFVHYKDKSDEYTSVLLDGFGEPAIFDPTGTGGTAPGQKEIEYYPERDLTLLGIPSSL